MPTAAEFAAFPDKRLLGATDFDARFFRYLRNESREAIKRLFIQGSFLERMPIAAGGTNRIQINAKPTYGDRLAHDGDGHILDLSQINTTTYFANVNAQVYEIGAAYIEHPKEIRTNPRTGAPEYDRYVEGIGVEATPSSVINNGSTLTFLINPLFEAGTTVANHAGRVVRVYKKVLAAGARTEAIAIETPTVTYDGANNRITTVGLLGQASTAVSTTPSDYVVQLIGLSVLRVQATNRPSVLPAKYFFLGTVTGNAGTPSTFVNTAQAVVRSQDAAQITMSALDAWADGTTNPAGTVQSVVAKIVSELKSPDNGRGLAKITAPALTGTPIAVAANRSDLALQAVLDAVNAETRRSECRAENASVQSLRLVATTSITPGELRAIAGVVWQGVAVRKIIAVGYTTAMIWDPTVKGGFENIPTSVALYSVACAPSGEIYACGEGGVYRLTGSSGSYAWSLVSATPGQTMFAIAYRAANDMFIAVGPNTIRGATPGGSWGSRTVPALSGGSTMINNVAASDLYFLATTQTGEVLRSANGGSTWITQGVVGSPSAGYSNNALDRSLSYCPELGFVLGTWWEYSPGTYSYRVAASLDGSGTNTSWTVSENGGGYQKLLVTTLDRQIALISGWNTSPYHSLPFTQVAPTAPVLDLQGNILLPLDPAVALYDFYAIANICGQVWAVGRNASGNGVICRGERFRPTYRGA